MKNKLHSLLYFLTAFLLLACSDKIDNDNFSDMIGDGQDYVPPPPVIIEPTLKDTKNWTIDTLDAGYIWYNYTDLYAPQKTNQIVNVLELDLSNPEYKLEFIHTTRDSLSSVALNENALGGINGTYEMDATFIKTNGNIISDISLNSDHLRFWKHEGAISYNGVNMASIGYGTKESYVSSSYSNIFSGAPMLIEDTKMVGESFVGDVSNIDLNSLPYEDYRRHQGVRHPRTAVALMPDNKILLITVDGRHEGKAGGMNAAELTQFIGKYFKPQHALNLDGGGSTTMWIKDSGKSPNNVVNYPTDNNKFDHNGQRLLSTFILIKKVSDEPNFARGDGTENNPYIITSSFHLNNMKSLDWSDSDKNPLYFKMEADVDMSGISWVPLNNKSGYSNHMHFDGNGHIIKNLTSKGQAYASFFGVLCGSCKDLGIINADIESTNAGGIISGYAGLKGPGAPTGTISNCFTSGKVSGTDAVGGIVGNIGKPNGDDVSGVYNSYSTATVIARNESGNSRAGGIAGIVFEKGVLENVYSSGIVISNNFAAGGIVGWSDASIKGCVALNKEVSNQQPGRLGRVSATMGSVGGVIAQGIDCWGLENMKLDNAGTQKPNSELATGVITDRNTPYDGITQTVEFLRNIQNYNQIGWKISGVSQIWSNKTNQKGYPILLWQYNRGDYNTLSGH